jgi:hypothetical protein
MKKIVDLLSTKFFIRLYLVMIAVIVGQKIYGVSYITDTMTLGAMGFITALIGIYTAEKVNTSKEETKKTNWR